VGLRREKRRLRDRRNVALRYADQRRQNSRIGCRLTCRWSQPGVQKPCPPPVLPPSSFQQVSDQQAFGQLSGAPTVTRSQRACPQMTYRTTPGQFVNPLQA
jgi:hypothetical protein